MTGSLLPALLAPLLMHRVLAERPGSVAAESGQIEFSFWGHLVAKRPRSSGAAAGQDAQTVLAPSWPNQGEREASPPASAAPGSFVELSDTSKNSSSHRSDSGKSEVKPSASHVNVSLAQMEVVAGDELHRAPLDPCSQTEGWKGCESLAHRTWIDSNEYCTCSAFDQEVKIKSNHWLPKEERKPALMGRDWFLSETDKVMDFWHWNLKLNVIDDHLDWYMDHLTSMANPGETGAFSPNTSIEVQQPVQMVLNCFALRRSYDTARATLFDRKDCTSALKNLQTTIDTVQNSHHFPYTDSVGLPKCRKLATAVEAFTNLQNQMAKGQSAEKLNNEESDKSLKALDLAIKDARSKLDKNFAKDAEQAQDIWNKLDSSLRKYFQADIKQAYDNLEEWDGESTDKLVTYRKDFLPLVARLQALSEYASKWQADSDLDDISGRNVLAKAESMKDKLEEKIRSQFDTTVDDAKQSLERRDSGSVLDRTMQDVKRELDVADDIWPFCQEQIMSLEKSKEQINALAEIQKVEEKVPEVIDEKKDVENEIEKEQEAHEEQHAVNATASQKNSTAESESAPAPAPPPAPVFKLSKALERRKKKSDSAVEKARQQLRKALDLAICAEMRGDFDDEFEKCEAWADDLGGIPPETGNCPARKQYGKQASSSGSQAPHKKLLGNIFGRGSASRTSQPAFIANLLLLWASVAWLLRPHV